MNSIDSSVIVISVIALLINALILYIVIAAATQSRKRALYDWASLELLAKIAKAQGVSQEEIADTFKRAGLYK